MSCLKKKLEILTIRYELILKIKKPLHNYCMLPQNYILDLESPQTECSCGGTLRKQWLTTRHPIGILLGKPRLRHHIKQCSICKKVYPFESINRLVPPHGNFSYDIIVEVGLARFLKNKQNKEIQEDLSHRYQIILSSSTISELTNRFLDYFGAIHYANTDSILREIKERGGYVLYLDGTCEAGTDIIFAAVDGISKWVLDCHRMPTENVNDIVCLLRRCKRLFGEPVALLRDLSDKIREAIKSVFPGKPDIVCHYHILENVAKKLFLEHHKKLTRHLRNSKIMPSLRSIRNKLALSSKKEDPISKEEISKYLECPEKFLNLEHRQLKLYLTYLLLCWLKDSGHDLKGEYFPFDLPNLALYRRCTRLYDILVEITNIAKFKLKLNKWTTPHTIIRYLSPVKNDEDFVTTAKRLEKSEKMFKNLRNALTLKNSSNGPILRQKEPLSTIDMALTMKKRITDLREHLNDIVQSKLDSDSDARCDAQIIISYLDKYWNNLFGHVIYLPEKDNPFLIDRTNNLLEQLFGNTKQKIRRRVGTKKLHRYFNSMRPEQILVENLKYQEYVDMLYDGNIKCMAQHFAKYWKECKDIRKKKKQCKDDRILYISRSIIRKPEFLNDIVKGFKILI